MGWLEEEEERVTRIVAQRMGALVPYEPTPTKPKTKRKKKETKMTPTALSVVPESEDKPIMDTTKNPEVSKAMSDALLSMINSVAGKVDVDQIKRIIREEVNKLPPVKYEIKVGKELKLLEEGYKRPEFFDALQCAYQRINVLMIGPAGCGKTHLGRQVAEAMGLRFGSISCSGGMSESHLTGWLLPVGDDSRFKYVPSVFVDLYENGGVFLFDEIDAADPNTLLFVNQAIANGSFFLPQRFDNPEVKRHPDSVILAAANTYGTGASICYAGRERLDEATLDRFRCGMIEVGYDEQLERSLIAPDVYKWGATVRAKINEAKLTRVMSTRFMIDATKLRAAGVEMVKIKETYFTGWKADELKKIQPSKA